MRSGTGHIIEQGCGHSASSPIVLGKLVIRVWWVDRVIRQGNGKH